jgi:hypothetical protein
MGIDGVGLGFFLDPRVSNSISSAVNFALADLNFSDMSDHDIKLPLPLPLPPAVEESSSLRLLSIAVESSLALIQLAGVYGGSMGIRGNRSDRSVFSGRRHGSVFPGRSDIFQQESTNGLRCLGQN